MGGDLDRPYGTFAFKTIYTDEGQEFGKQFDLFCESRHIHHTKFGPTTGKKTRLGIVERFNRTLRELYNEHIKTIYPEITKVTTSPQLYHKFFKYTTDLGIIHPSSSLRNGKEV